MVTSTNTFFGVAGDQTIKAEFEDIFQGRGKVSAAYPIDIK